MNREDVVKEFNAAFNLPVDVPVSTRGLHLCMKLIAEETDELGAEFSKYMETGELDIENLLKELADLQYVISGLAVRFGLDLEEAFRRVHASNMTKLGDDGKPVYNHAGKVMKGPNYKKPCLKDLVK